MPATVPKDRSNADTDTAEQRADLKTLLLMAGFLRYCRVPFALTILLLLATVYADIKSIELLAEPIDHVKALVTTDHAHEGFVAWLYAEDPAVQGLLYSLLVILLLRLGLSVLQYWRSLIESRTQMTFVYHMRQAVFHKLQIVGFSFYDRMTSGQLINRALQDLGAVRQFVLHGSFVILEMLARLGTWALVLYLIHPMLLLAVTLPLPLWVWLLLRYSSRARPVFRAQLNASDEVVRTLAENVEGVLVVKAFGRQQGEMEKFDARAEALRDRQIDAAVLARTYIPRIRLVGTATNVAVFAVACWFVMIGEITVGALIVVSQAIGQILAQLQVIQPLTEQFQKARVSAARVAEILAAPSRPAELPDARPIQISRGEVKFINVTFGYSPQRPVLHDVSLKAPPGKITAIVGPSGSGKSTLLSLLARFYDPDRGVVLIDGQDVKTLTLPSLRRSIGYTFQEAYLFSQTVRENICQRWPDAPEDAVIAAAEIADCTGFISQLPQKWDTLIGERGVSLSGGQRQRLALARALLADPPILVLDDTLAAVDANTETQILTLLDLATAGRTVFVVAHRLSTVQRADQVIVLDRGRIVAKGTHEELLERPGYYQQVARLQLAAGHDPPSAPYKAADTAPLGI